jgi:DNA-binding MarR family transcriptional regulator
MAKRLGTSRRAALDELSAQIAGLARRYQMRSRDRVCRHGITVSECYALESIVEADGMLVTEVARAVALDKSTTSRVIDALHRRGLVRFQDVPGNARAKKVVPSSRGGRLARTIAGEIRAEHRRAFGSFSGSELATCARLLRALAAVPASRGVD